MPATTLEKPAQKSTRLRRRARRKFTPEYKATILNTIKDMEDVDDRLKFLKKEHLYPALVERWETPRIIRSDKEVRVLSKIEPNRQPQGSDQSDNTLREENKRLKLELELYKEMNESLIKKLSK